MPGHRSHLSPSEGCSRLGHRSHLGPSEGCAVCRRSQLSGSEGSHLSPSDGCAMCRRSHLGPWEGCAMCRRRSHLSQCPMSQRHPKLFCDESSSQ